MDRQGGVAIRPTINDERNVHSDLALCVLCHTGVRASVCQLRVLDLKTVCVLVGLLMVQLGVYQGLLVP